MPNTEIKCILENVISLTSERESDGLELALAQTLLKLAVHGSVSIYHASNIDRIKYPNTLIGKHHQGKEIPAGILGSLKKCLSEGEVIYTPHQGKKLTLLPLVSGNKQPIAVITIESTQDSYNHELIIMILKIYNNFLALMNENERDTLTGLLNRKTFDLKINSIISSLQNESKRRSADSGDPYFIALFDIDHFKCVNDTFGHLIGDEVLLLFAQILRKSFRGKDLLFRFGGEEFIGVFQCPSDQVMDIVLNRFRQNIEKFNFPQIGQVTVSSGFTKINEFDLSSVLIDRADVALYHAKNNGRNQICQHEQLISSGVLEHCDNTGDIELF